MSKLLRELLGAALPGAFTANQLSVVPNSVEDEEENTAGKKRASKFELARKIFEPSIANPEISRNDVIEQFVQRLGVTQSTAVTYYERLAKEYGLTNKQKDDINLDEPSPTDSEQNQEDTMEIEPDTNTDLDLEDEVTYSDDPDKQGIIRTVDSAHLVYKRQNEEGTYDELWVYNIFDNLNKELDIRRDILSGTDIPPKRTRSPDGTQHYTLSTLGNAQLLYISGLPQ